jgi:hypothetical protein
MKPWRINFLTRVQPLDMNFMHAGLFGSFLQGGAGGLVQIFVLGAVHEIYMHWKGRVKEFWE